MVSATVATIISSVITSAVTLAICLITNNAERKRTEALIEYRLDALTQQVEKHNNVVERMTVLEIRHNEMEKDVNELWKKQRESA